MDYFSSVDPVKYLGSAVRGQALKFSKQNASKEFAAIFYSEILRQVFGGEKEVIGGENSFFGRNPVSVDLFIDQLAMKLAESGKLSGEDIFRVPGGIE
ncbi:MAG: hypothetical protein NT030_06440 [Candidatus Saganbacteria bacterium]|nr:hypothetical protein [Candidatus Saganbacteria bacterium]